MQLTKHHGLGNDFLISVGHWEDITRAAQEIDRRGVAPHLCDRRIGVGADGLIVLCRREQPDGDHATTGEKNGAPDNNQPEPETWDMILWNSDGSRAELSGNGLRCVGQALAQHTGASAFAVHTAAGLRRVVVVAGDVGDATIQVEVEMAEVGPGPEPWGGWHDLGLNPSGQFGVDVGNPHLVVFVPDIDAVELAKVGPVVEESYPEGVNVEFVAHDPALERSSDAPSSETVRDQVDMRVWERGAGITQACGSGAVATAWAARRMGIGGDRLIVSMPGGAATVSFVGDAARLTGPATFVATLEVDMTSFGSRTATHT